jgi:opacity protein-like surface antigen
MSGQAHRSWFLCRAGVALLALGVVTSPASAQTNRPATSSQPETFAFRGFGDVGGINFTASNSFKAVLGTSSGFVFGGGVEGVLPQRVFFGIRASRFSKSGSRTFTANGQTFDLGIPTEVTITPLELYGGYRFAPSRAQVIPYAGGGVGWHKYSETSSFADASENVKQTFQGYQILGGVEFRISRLFGASVEAQWTAVPNALGQNPSSVGTALNETDLGGTTIRGKVVIGR